MSARLSGPTLITGGCGFVGANVAAYLLASGQHVILFDDLSRPGVERNLQWLQTEFGERAEFVRGDIRDFNLLSSQVHRASQVFHFAAQVAVTTSLADPIQDFEVNARGTLNLLEALREMDAPPPLLFTSTNKVYGGLPDIALRIEQNGYQPEDEHVRAHGISEHRPLDFHSPYGCSKGAADQYVIDYARTFCIPAVVFRMSCIYGYHQFGTEDQGWVAHFLIQALNRRSITLYGDGRQVRDILFIDDLVQAMMLAIGNIDRLSGHAFNIGGGPANTVSLIGLLDMIGQLNTVCPDVSYEQWRPGDQRYYVSDTRSFTAATGWRPAIDVETGVARLHAWLAEQRRTATAGASGASLSSPRRRSSESYLGVVSA